MTTMTTTTTTTAANGGTAAAARKTPADPAVGTQCGPVGERLVVSLVDELARDTPSRVWATVTNSAFDIEQGFRDITFAECASAVNAAAWSIAEAVGASSDFGVIAYLGVSDVRYAIYLFAAIKTGHTLMVPSVRNSLQQHMAVFEDAKCSILYYTPEMAPVAQALKEKRPQLRALEAPPLPSLLASSGRHYPYTKAWADARTDPIVIAHSSGSTGNPKPTAITNGVYSAYDNHRKAEKIPGRLNQTYELLNLDGERFFNPFPPFHLAGLFAMSIMPVFYACIVTTGPPDKPPSGSLLSRAMQMLKIRAAWCPPAVIEQLADLPRGADQIGTLDWIMYTGGPLAPAVGDRICRATKVCQMYGSTETGPHLSLIPQPENWSYFEWHPAYENEMEDMGDGTFEMVVHRNPAQDWLRHFSQAYPHIDVWRTRDLFVPSPHNPKLWRFAGRRDDVLVLSNGEKFNPVDMEGVVTGHPLVRGGLIVGTARFQASLIIEPTEEARAMADKDLVEALWPTIEQANAVGPAHGRIFRSKVLVAPAAKAFIRAGKGTVIRGRTTRLFEEEVDALYREEAENGDNGENGVPTPPVDSLEAMTDLVRTAVTGLLPSSVALTDEDDFFAMGFDSLQSLELLKMLKRSLAAHAGIGSDILSTRGIYASPSVAKLASRLFAAVSAGEAAGQPENGEPADHHDRTKVMRNLVTKYTADLPCTTARAHASLCIAVTGSTGSLGTHILEALLRDPGVRKVYCLNRSAGAEARQRAALAARGKTDALGLLAARAVFLKVDFDDAHLGLGAADFADLRAHVDVVIHNAWKVDFNHPLPAFEATHIRGVRHLVDFALASERQPHLFYVSSLSSAGNWPAVKAAEAAEAAGPAEGGGATTRLPPVPETFLPDYNMALPMGYGESKFVAETILQTAVARARLHATVLRVGQIAGPLAADGGQWNPAEWLPSLVRSAKTLGCVPDAMNSVDWIPVDALAQVVRELVHHDYGRSACEVYNLANPRAARWLDLVQALVARWGPATKVVPFAQWLAALQAVDTPDVEQLPAIKILDFYKGLAAESALPARERVAYATDKARAHSATMAALGPVDGQAMATWLQQWGY